MSDAVVTGPGSAPGTLRQAIYDANHSPGADLIQFTAGLSGNVNLSVADDTTVGPSALLVTSQMTIQGTAAGITIKRDAAASDMRLFLVASGGDLTLDSVMLTGGLVRGDDGGTGQSGGAALGGAVYNQGTLQLVASTFYGNAAIGGNAGTGGYGGAGYGGAVYNDGGTLDVRNATFSGNSVSSGAGTSAFSSSGGAIYSKNGSLTVYNSTITQNSAVSGRGLCIIANAPGQTTTAQIYSTIIGQADSPGPVLDFLASADAGGNLEVVGANNLIRRQNDYQSITVSSDDPLLGALANNGGPTLTHELMAGSPAIGQGSNLLSLSTDQRGDSYSRVVGGATDIGAFEVQSVAGPALPGDYNGDQVVDAADYVLWRKTIGDQVSQYMGADGNGSSAIDAGDYDVWRGNFGASSSAGAAVSSFESATDSASVENAALAGADSAFAFNREPLSASRHAELMAAFADYSNPFARAERRTNSLVGGERTAPFANFQTQDVQTRDEALLAILRGPAPSPDSRGATADMKNAFELDAAHSASRGLRSTADALNQALLQTATFGAASSGRA